MKTEDKMDDVSDAIRNAFVPQPDWALFGFSSVLNILIVPALIFVTFYQAGLLPFSFSGFFSVVITIFTLRICVLDRGLAKTIYKE